MVYEWQENRHNCLYIYNDHSYEPLARIEHSAYHGTRRHDYHNHINGCPEALINEQGDIDWQGQFDSFGKTLQLEQNEDALSVGQNLRYQGQYFDQETGLHYNTFRYYDPEIGRFTQQDPIGLAGGLNLYEYAPNPIHWVDPWGWSRHCKITNVKKTNGRKPINSKYAGKTFYVNGSLKREYPHGVPFNIRGFPDFSRYSIKNTRIKLTGSRTKDFSLANKNVGLKSTPDGYTWHHHEDPGVMKLIPADIHDAVRHTGGIATGK